MVPLGPFQCGRRRTIDLALERLSADEVMVIKGALAMSTKTATDVMVKLEDVYMLPSDAILDDALAHEVGAPSVAINYRSDSEVLFQIFNVGHSRIPVYEGERTNIIGVIFTKRVGASFSI